jgi:hypothetical protein
VDKLIAEKPNCPVEGIEETRRYGSPLFLRPRPRTWLEMDDKSPLHFDKETAKYLGYRIFEFLWRILWIFIGLFLIGAWAELTSHSSWIIRMCLALLLLICVGIFKVLIDKLADRLF